MSEDCRLIQGKLPAYSKGELSPDERDKVTGHLGACSSCGQELALLLSRPAAPAPSKSRRGASNPVLVGIVVALVVAAVGLRVVQSRRVPAVKAVKPAPAATPVVAPVATPVSIPVSAPASGPVPASGTAEPFPPVSKAPAQTEEPKAPPVGRRVQMRLYAKDVMAANDRFLHLLAEIPARLVEPPIPIRYDLMLQPEVAEIFLQRLKEIGPTEVQQDTAGAPGAPVRLTVEILSRD